MQQHTKTSYHPYLLVAFYLNCLPKNILQIIPRSTKFDWNHRDIQDSFGYDWFLENKDLFHTLQMVAINKKLLKINKAFLRVIAIIRFMKVNAAGIKAGRILLKTVVVSHIQKVAATFGVKQTLKYLNLNFQQYATLKRNISCVSSIFNLCRINTLLNFYKKKSMSLKHIAWSRVINCGRFVPFFIR
jgi:hypothetical protein